MHKMRCAARCLRACLIYTRRGEARQRGGGEGSREEVKGERWVGVRGEIGGGCEGIRGRQGGRCDRSRGGKERERGRRQGGDVRGAGGWVRGGKGQV